MGLCLQNQTDNKLCATEAFHKPVTVHIQGQTADSPDNNTCTLPHTTIICKQTVRSIVIFDSGLN